MPQDQEGAPGRPENLVNGFKMAYSNGTESNTGKPIEPQSEHCCATRKDEATCYSNASDELAHRQGDWLPNETLVLLEAKRKEQDMFSGSRRSILTADDKWKFVSDYCRTQSVQRSKEQCRFKWENMLPDYRKIKEYEELKDTAEQSYFTLDSCEKKTKQLPSNMDLDVYQRISSIMCNKPAKGGLGGLKREARERKFSDGPPVGEFLGKNFPGAPRRTRRKLCERVQTIRTAHDLEADSRSDSSTEEDIAVTAARWVGRAGGVSLHDEMNAVAAQRRLLENRNALAVYKHDASIHRPSQNGQTEGLTTPPDARRYKETTNPSTDRSTHLLTYLKDRKDSRHKEPLTYIEDRKDARHKELLALEREKLALFREASFTIANAMSSAIGVFSKMAEELLQRR